ncbi:hypothetical protein B484DRAFT_457619 [Ochromonadaceae sp. CCMP2298]|nr:hypothetical protein B484DRAFT_457619 [Ochromonadaceae sp. CCMP2298]
MEDPEHENVILDGLIRKREEAEDDEVNVVEDHPSPPLIWGGWTEAMKYSLAEQDDPWKLMKASVYPNNNYAYYRPIPGDMAGGVYEWKCVLRFLNEFTSVVFYAGRSTNVSTRISGERRLTVVGMQLLADRVKTFVLNSDITAASEATFSVRFAPCAAAHIKSVELDLLAQFDYASNKGTNGSLRIDDGMDELVPGGMPGPPPPPTPGPPPPPTLLDLAVNEAAVQAIQAMGGLPDDQHEVFLMKFIARLAILQL